MFSRRNSYKHLVTVMLTIPSTVTKHESFYRKMYIRIDTAIILDLSCSHKKKIISRGSSSV